MRPGVRLGRDPTPLRSWNDQCGPHLPFVLRPPVDRFRDPDPCGVVMALDATELSDAHDPTLEEVTPSFDNEPTAAPDSHAMEHRLSGHTKKLESLRLQLLRDSGLVSYSARP